MATHGFSPANLARVQDWLTDHPGARADEVIAACGEGKLLAHRTIPACLAELLHQRRLRREGDRWFAA